MKRLPIISIFSGTVKWRILIQLFRNLGSKQIQHCSSFEEQNFNDHTKTFKDFFLPNCDVKAIFPKTRFTTMFLCQISSKLFVIWDPWFHSRESSLLIWLLLKFQFSTRKCTFSGWAKSWSISYFHIFGDNTISFEKRARYCLRKLIKGLATFWWLNPAFLCNFEFILSKWICNLTLNFLFRWTI